MHSLCIGEDSAMEDRTLSRPAESGLNPVDLYRNTDRRESDFCFDSAFQLSPESDGAWTAEGGYETTTQSPTSPRPPASAVLV